MAGGSLFVRKQRRDQPRRPLVLAQGTQAPRPAIGDKEVSDHAQVETRVRSRAVIRATMSRLVVFVRRGLAGRLRLRDAAPSRPTRQRPGSPLRRHGWHGKTDGSFRATSFVVNARPTDVAVSHVEQCVGSRLSYGRPLTGSSSLPTARIDRRADPFAGLCARVAFAFSS
jgi:hypothetical protein